MAQETNRDRRLMPVNFIIQPISFAGKVLSLVEVGLDCLMTGLLVAILVRRTVKN